MDPKYINGAFETDREFLGGNGPLFEASQFRREVVQALDVYGQLLPIFLMLLFKDKYILKKKQAILPYHHLTLILFLFLAQRIQ